MFENMCPGEEFLPKAPNPEDIIYDDGESGGERESGFESTSDTVTVTDCDVQASLDSSTNAADDSAVTDVSSHCVTEGVEARD